VYFSLAYSERFFFFYPRRPPPSPAVLTSRFFSHAIVIHASHVRCPSTPPPPSNFPLLCFFPPPTISISSKNPPTLVRQTFVLRRFSPLLFHLSALLPPAPRRLSLPQRFPTQSFAHFTALLRAPFSTSPFQDSLMAGTAVHQPKPFRKDHSKTVIPVLLHSSDAPIFFPSLSFLLTRTAPCPELLRSPNLSLSFNPKKTYSGETFFFYFSSQSAALDILKPPTGEIFEGQYVPGSFFSF